MKERPKGNMSTVFKYLKDCHVKQSKSCFFCYKGQHSDQWPIPQGQRRATCPTNLTVLVTAEHHLYQNFSLYFRLNWLIPFAQINTF